MLHIRSCSTDPQMMSSSALDSWTCWTLWTMGMGSKLTWGENDLISQLVPCLCWAYTRWYSHTSAFAEVSPGVREGPCGGANAGSFPSAYGRSLW